MILFFTFLNASLSEERNFIYGNYVLKRHVYKLEKFKMSLIR